MNNHTYKTDANCISLFNEFMELKKRCEDASRHIQLLACIVQNQDIEITKEQLNEFGADCRSVCDNLRHLDEDIDDMWPKVIDYFINRR